MRCPWCGDEGQIIDCKRCGGRHCEHNVIRCNTLKRKNDYLLSGAKQ